jgi:hypothetical protein
VADANIVVLAIPPHRFGDIDPALLDGKLVVDAMNYWPASDGGLKAFEDGGSSEIVAGGWSARPWSKRSITSAATNSKTGHGQRPPRTGGPPASRAATPRRP